MWLSIDRGVQCILACIQNENKLRIFKVLPLGVAQTRPYILVGFYVLNM